LDFDTSILSYVFNIIYLVFIFGFSFFSQKLQVNIALGKVSKSLNKLEKMRDKAKEEAISAINKLGKPEIDPKSRLESLLYFFSISPNNMDPKGVVQRLEHLVNSADNRFKDEIKLLAPSADEKQLQNLGNLVETAHGLNSLYRTVRHHYLSGKKGGSIYTMTQIQMELPMIMEEAEAYFSFIDAFKNEKPIGDGIGPLVASTLIADAPFYSIAEETIAAEVTLDDRNAIVTRAQGPGGTVGKAGDAVNKLVKQQKEEFSMIVMVDAGLKLEGETSGTVVEGIGAAIGGVGVEQFKIEEIATKHKIPVFAIVVRQSLKEALAPMTDAVRGSVDEVLKRIKRLVSERTKPGDKIMIVGVGNTIGVA